MSSLERAVEIAAQAHAGQKDKAGAVYLLHPLRVMLNLDDATEAERIVAVLHDVIEDTDWTSDRLLEEGFSQEIVRALESVTKRPDEDYMAFVRRAGTNEIGRKIKHADIEDNLRPLKDPTPKDCEKRALYREAARYLASLS